VLRRIVAIFAGAIVGLYVAAPVPAITVLPPGAINADGSFRSVAPRDNFALTPPTGDYIEQCIGADFTACQTAEDIDGGGSAEIDDGAAIIQTNLSNRRTGLTGISWIPIETAIDGKVKAEVVSVTGTNTYRAAGVAIFADDGMGDPDYENGVRCQQPASAGQPVRLVPIIAGVQGTVEYSGSTDTDLPEPLTIQYDYSADLVQCLEWNTAEAEWDLVAEYTLNLTAPYHLAITAESDTPAGNSATATFNDVVFDNTLEVIGDDSPPPDPDPDPNSGAGSYPDPVLGTTMLGGRTAANCTTAACIQTNLVCGRTITLTANITAEVTINSSCAANNPAYIVGAGFEAQETWTYTTASARNIVKGVKFTSTSTQVRFGGTNNKHIGNEHTGFGSASISAAYAICLEGGSGGEIGYNWIHHPGAWLSPLSGTPLRIGIRSCEESDGTNFHFDAWIHHNLFSDFPDKPIPTTYSSGQNDAIEICETNTRAFITTIDTGMWIERNLILRHLQGGGTGAATIDLKCAGGMVVRYNTFSGSNGRLDTRGPSTPAIWFEGNYVPRGFTLHGAAIKLLGNFGPTILRAGGSGCSEQNLTGSYHSRVCNTLVEGGTGTLLVGQNAGPGTQLPALNTTIRGRSCTGITLGNHSGTTNNCASAAQETFTEAFQVTEAEVGPTALSLASAAYREPRLQ
jgi:hypothetical protein